MILSYENQIARINQNLARVKSLEALSLEALMERPAKGGWCVLEVVEHMCRSYEPHYKKEIDRLLNQFREAEEPQEQLRAGWLGRWFIKGIAPSKGRRKWKMKTFKQFEPQQPVEGDIKVLNLYQQQKNYLKDQVKRARNKKLGKEKVISAVGPVVKFTLPEAIEFVISHDERHLLQIEEVLQANGATTKRKAPVA